jgi:hypothetical protein
MVSTSGAASPDVRRGQPCGITEIPWCSISVSGRDCTGMATRTEQGDLTWRCFAATANIPRAVFAPGSMKGHFAYLRGFNLLLISGPRIHLPTSTCSILLQRSPPSKSTV